MRNPIGLLAYLVLGMALSETQTFGFAETVRKMLSEVQRALEKAGWDVDAVLGGLQKLYEATLAANETQEAAKRQAKEATNTFVAMKHQLYVTASGYLDMAIAAVGKDTDEAKNLRHYRSRIHRPEADVPNAETLPEPPPSAQ